MSSQVFPQAPAGQGVVASQSQDLIFTHQALHKNFVLLSPENVFPVRSLSAQLTFALQCVGSLQQEGLPHTEVLCCLTLVSMSM